MLTIFKTQFFTAFSDNGRCSTDINRPMLQYFRIVLNSANLDLGLDFSFVLLV